MYVISMCECKEYDVISGNYCVLYVMSPSIYVLLYKSVYIFYMMYEWHKNSYEMKL